MVSFPVAKVSNDKATDSGSVQWEEDQGAKVAIIEHSANLPVFISEQSNLMTDSLDMACPVLGAMCEPHASAGKRSTTEPTWQTGNLSTVSPFASVGNESTTEFLLSARNKSTADVFGVVPTWTTPVLGDFELNSIACVLCEPESSWSVSDNNVDIVDELNSHRLMGERDGNTALRP